MRSRLLQICTKLIVALTIGVLYHSNGQTELLTNGSFASNATGWTLSGNFQADSRFSSCRSCYGYSYLSKSDGSAGNSLSGSMYQTISIPSNATTATLTFWYYITSQEAGSVAYDILTVSVKNSSGGNLTTLTILSNINKGSSYTQKSFNLTSYKGQTIRIHFSGMTDASLPTTFRVDDVSVLATTVTGSITITSPSSEVNWYKGTSYSVQWNSQNTTAPLKVELYSANSMVRQLTTTAPTSGEVTFNPPTDVTDGTDYRIAIAEMNGSAYKFSGYFSISTPVVIPIAPTPTSPGSASSPGNSVTTLTPVLVWNAVSGATDYGVYVSKKNSIGGYDLVFDSQERGITITNTSLTVPTGVLERDAEYRWNVNAHNSAGWGLYSNRLYFNVVYPTSTIASVTPNPLTPASAAVGQTLNIGVTVGLEAASNGVLQVWLYDDDFSVSIQKWIYLPNPVSTVSTFDFAFTWNQSQMRSYNIYTQFRPGALSGPLNDCRVNDVVSNTSYQVNWRGDASGMCITTSLALLQPGPYVVGQCLTATFSITNRSSSPITFDVLTVGGRLIVNGEETCPDGTCPDFQFVRNLTLAPNGTHNYQGNIQLKQPGIYHFFTTYASPANNWNTNIASDPGIITTKDIDVGLQPMCLSFPLSDKTPANVTINSVFDHSMSGVGYPKDNSVIAYTGEIGKKSYGYDPDFMSGYKQDFEGVWFKVNDHYTGGCYLYYDGHPGFDFRAPSGTPVYADGDGVVHYPASIPGIQNAPYYYVLEVDHGNDYKSYYLHLLSHPNANNAVVAEGTTVRVGDLVGYSGSAGTPAPHLHYEVQHRGVPIDPYGWQGHGVDPYSIGRNIFLWPISFLEWNPDESMPVELSDFTARAEGNAVRLMWKTVSEFANYGFDIERRGMSSPQSDWIAVGFVSGHGTSNVGYEYQLTDAGLTSGLYAYRIKQVDNNGTFTYYDAVEVAVTAPMGFFLSQNFPNPFNASTKIRYGIPNKSHVMFNIVNTLGQVIAELVHDDQAEGFYEVIWNAPVATGCYFGRLTGIDNSGHRFNQIIKIVVAK